MSGAILTPLASVGAVCFLAYNLYISLAPGTGGESLMTPLVPGINIPVSQLAYFTLALLAAGGLHELGHAYAAARCVLPNLCSLGLDVQEFGLFLLLLYPGAYVELRSEQLSAQPPWQRLKIISGSLPHQPQPGPGTTLC